MFFAFSPEDANKSVTLEEGEREKKHIILLIASHLRNMALLHHFKWDREIFYWSFTWICLQSI